MSNLHYLFCDILLIQMELSKELTHCCYQINNDKHRYHVSSEHSQNGNSAGRISLLPKYIFAIYHTKQRATL